VGAGRKRSADACNILQKHPKSIRRCLCLGGRPATRHLPLSCDILVRTLLGHQINQILLLPEQSMQAGCVSCALPHCRLQYVTMWEEESHIRSCNTDSDSLSLKCSNSCILLSTYAFKASGPSTGSAAAWAVGLIAACVVMVRPLVLASEALISRLLLL